MMLKVKINGRNYEAEKGEYILNVCRRNRILIPTICNHESLSGQGACRLCVVEVNEGKGNNVVVSCSYPLSRDCEVFTESEKIQSLRRIILSMLITRAPAGDRLASLCQIYGVTPDNGAVNKRFTALKGKKRRAASPQAADRMPQDKLSSACVLCGLCARACASLGTGAISTVGRGVDKMISTPYGGPSEDCIGCKSCANVCPTKAIECIESTTSRGKAQRSIWGRKFKLLRCASCGAAFATEEEYAYSLKKAAAEKPALEKFNLDKVSGPPVCEACRKKKNADAFASAFGERV